MPPPFGIVQREGDVRLRAMDRVTAATLKKAIAEHADPIYSCLMTDDSNAYKGIGRKFTGSHRTTNHSDWEYVKKDNPWVHSNTIESVFSLLKRGLFGTWHSVSKKHLHKYLGEFEFRYNARKVEDAERVAMAIRKADGKRLTYSAHVSSGT